MITFNEALNNYYQFKTLYESSYNKEKRDIINNKKLSWNEKRSEFQKLKKKCINCKRPVGTIFSRNFNDDGYTGFTTLSAVCGDRVKPCKLNINLKTDSVDSLENNVKILDDSIKENKNLIIQKKNELLFGYITAEKAIDTFDEYKKILNETYDLKNYFLEILISRTDNEDKKRELKELLTEYYLIIKNMGQDIKDANTDNNLQLIEDTIRNNYVDLLMSRPDHIGKLEKIRNLKYMYCNVEYDEDTNEYHLIQKKNTIASLEEPFNAEVISYVFGVFESKGKTKKKKEIEIKSKTRKLRIEESSSSKEKVQEQESLPVIPSKSPIIGQDGSVTWQDENYKKAWSYLSQKHRDLLAKDPIWLQESMDPYVKNVQERVVLKFVYPRNIIFPPRKLPDGSFDFGNQFYNEVMNANKGLIMDYLKDLERIGKPGNNITRELADTWFKGRLEEKIYDYFYPVRSQLIGR
jgi:hypothetical protein